MTHIQLPKVKHGKTQCSHSKVEFNQIQNGDFFTYDAPDFANSVFVMIDNKKCGNGQCLNLTKNQFTWFSPYSNFNRYIIFKDVEIKHPFYGLTTTT